MPLVGHQHQIDILELTDKGDGKGRLFDRPLFVEGLLPGEQALVELTEVKPNYLHGKLVELTQPSADRVPIFAPTPNAVAARCARWPIRPSLPSSRAGAERTGAGRAG
jgi:23S rRNA (uracil1939-C5)-methyltransferase